MLNPAEVKTIKVLIANRGEIASRIIRACAALKITSVALCDLNSSSDFTFAKSADESVYVASESKSSCYLDADLIIQTGMRVSFSFSLLRTNTR